MDSDTKTPLPNRDKRFAPSTTAKDYDIKRGKLNGLQAAICRHHVEGKKNVQVAKMLNITPETVANVLGSDLGAIEVATLKQAMTASTVDVGKRIIAMQEDARQVVSGIMNGGEKEENRLRSALYILGVGGHSPVQKKQTTGAVGIFDLSDIKDITNRIPKKEENNNDKFEDANVVE